MIFTSTTNSRSSMRRAARVASALFVALLISQASSVASFAIGVSGAAPFGLSPSPDSHGVSRPYFELQVLPGQSVSDSVVVSDQGRSPETLLISPALGVTASNSGTAFQGAFEPCSGVSCWITGLPSSVNLAPGQSLTLPFSVRVPAGTAPSQYLAGITAKPAETPGATVIGGNNKTSVNAIIIHEITIGVAISTGTVSQLTSKLVITGVSGAYIGTVPRIMVVVQNQGQRYAKGVGTATCSENGLKKSLPVNVNTVLPGQSATVPVNAVEFKSIADCVVQLNYGTAAPAAWTGSVKIPVAAPSVQVPIAKGVYATLPAAKIPTWGVALLIAAGVLVLLALVWLLIALRRRRKRRRAELLARANEASPTPVVARPSSDVGPLDAPSAAAQPVGETAREHLEPSSLEANAAAGAVGVAHAPTDTLEAPAPIEHPDTASVKSDKATSKKKSAKRSSKKNR